jgi:hypothetical protein
MSDDRALALANYRGTQDVLAPLGVDKYGQLLFYPDTANVDADLGL